MADTSALVYGGDLLIFVGSTTGTTLPLAFSTSAKLSITMGVKDATSKDSGIYSDKLAGRIEWNMSADGLMSYTVTGSTNTVDELYTLMLTRATVSVAFAIKTGTTPSWTMDATKKHFTGSALITNIEMTSDNDNATYSIKLDGIGALTLA